MHIAFTAVAIVMNGEVCLLSDWIRLFPFTLHHFSLDVHLQTEMQHEIIQVESLNWSVFQNYWLNGYWGNGCTQRETYICVRKKGKKKNTALCADLTH